MNKRIIPIIISAFMAMTACSGNGAETEITTASEASSSTVSITAAESTEQEVTKMTREIDPTKPMIALTFDDGPNITTTMKVLDVLEKYEVPASFFLIGDNITSLTERVVKRAYDMGCEINNHSRSHSYMNKMTAEEIQAEVQYVTDKVTEIIGEPTKFFRPPYIAVNSEMYDNIDMPFICGYGCNDWEDSVTVESRVEKTLSQAEDGAIILLHDAAGNNKTVEAIDQIIPALLDEGYQFVTVGELFEAKGVAIDPDDTNLYTVVK